MASVTFNPFTGTLDFVGSSGGGGGTPGGSDTQIQFNDGGSFGGDADLTYNKTTNKFTTKGDVELNDGGTFTTTVQCVTPTANRTISFPDATGTIGLVAGSSGQVVYNNAGAYAGVSTMTFDGTSVTLAGRLINSYTSVASSPAKVFTGTWFTGGTATTTKPHFLIEPSGATSTAWSTSGTGLGVNAASGFAGKLVDLQLNGTSQFAVDASSGTGVTCMRLQASNRIDATNLITVGTATILSNGSLSLGASGTADTIFTRDAANTFAQRNATNAQTFRCYGTYTDASNYVRAALSSTSTAVTLAAETAGTGADDITLNLTAAGTGTVKANSSLEIADAKDIVLATTTGTKIGTATTQKLGFYNATPVVQPAAVANITTTATAGTLPTADGTVTIADATTPTVAELLEYCVELEAKLEAALGHLRTLGLIAT